MDEPVHFILMVIPCVSTRPMEKENVFHRVEFGQNKLEFCFGYDGYPKSMKG